MLFIAGTKGEVTTVGKGEFFCPQCEQRTKYLHNQVHEKVTLFFVPVANLKLLGEYIECQRCSGTFKLEVLNYNPEQNEQAFKVLYFEGMKKVLVMMMLADGKIEDEEKKMIKDVYLEFTGHEVELSDADIQEEIDHCCNEPSTLENYLETLFPYLNDHGKEMIVKAAYYVSIADGEFHEKEEHLILEIAKKLQLSSAHVKGIIAEVHEQ